MRVACRAAGDAIRVDLSVRPPALRRRPPRGPRATEDAWEDAGGGAVRAGARVEAWSVPYGPSDARALLHRSTAHRFNLGPPSASRPVFIGTIRKFVRASAQCARSRRPALRRVRARAAASAPARRRQTVGRRAPHTRGGCRACARNRTLTAREISETIELTTFRTHPP